MAMLAAMNDDTPPQKELPLIAPKRRVRKPSTAVAVVPRRVTKRQVLVWGARGLAGVAAFYMALILLFSVLPPPINLYQMGEAWRLGGIEKDWVSIDDMAPAVARSAVAAEDANFCLHWGFDMQAIRAAIEEGGERGGSTITQQVMKNFLLGGERTGERKIKEIILASRLEETLSKDKILELYLNEIFLGQNSGLLELVVRVLTSIMFITVEMIDALILANQILLISMY